MYKFDNQKNLKKKKLVIWSKQLWCLLFQKKVLVVWFFVFTHFGRNSLEAKYNFINNQSNTLQFRNSKPHLKDNIINNLKNRMLSNF